MNARLIVLFIALTFVAACSPAPYTRPEGAPLPLSPSIQEAQRLIDAATNTALAVNTQQAVATLNAQATLDTASRDATAIAIVANARATESAALFAPTQTVAAATAVAAQSTQAFVTAATAQSIAATQSAEAEAHAQNMELAVTIFWMSVVALPVLCLTVAGCVYLLRLARSHKLNQTFELIYDEDGLLRGYRDWRPSTGWVVTLLGPTRALGPSANPATTPEAEARAAWAEFVKDVARAASMLDSWSINKLSTRKGGAAVAPEDQIEHARQIALEVGAVTDYGSNTGLNWAAGWNLPRLEAELDDDIFFTLPHRDDNSLIPAPTADLSHCNATQSNAANARNAASLFRSPMQRSSVHS